MAEHSRRVNIFLMNMILSEFYGAFAQSHSCSRTNNNNNNNINNNNNEQIIIIIGSRRAFSEWR
jgi:hypothetical protein